MNRSEYKNNNNNNNVCNLRRFRPLFFHFLFFSLFLSLVLLGVSFIQDWVLTCYEVRTLRRRVERFESMSLFPRFKVVYFFLN